MMALENNRILASLNASSQDILAANGDFASVGGSTYKNSPELFSPETHWNISSDEQEELSDMDGYARTTIGICLGFALVANFILAIITGLAFSNRMKRRRDSFKKDEDEPMRQDRFRFYCSRIANVICCKWKNEVKSPIEIIVEDYDQTLMMQQAKIEQKRETPEMNGQKENNTPGTIQIQIFTVEPERHRTSTEFKDKQIKTGTNGLEAIRESQDDGNFADEGQQKT